MPSNDNHSLDGLSPTSIDPHGHAALLLVESLLHGLMERSLLSTADAVEIVETAMEVQAEVAEMADGAGQKLWRSHALLTKIAMSLRQDLHASGDGNSPVDGV